MVFSSGIAPRFRLSIILLARGFTIVFVLNIPTFLAVEKSTGMFSPSQYGTLIPPDLIGSTFILSDLSSTLRILHSFLVARKHFLDLRNLQQTFDLSCQLFSYLLYRRL